MDRETRNHVLWIAFLWVVFSALGEWVVQAAIDRWPLISSAQGEITGEAIFFLLRAVVPLFVAIVLILAYSALRFRVPDDDERPAEAQFAGGGAFVFVWVGLSVILNVLFVIYPGIYGLEALWGSARAAAASNPLTVEVTAKQWEWDFLYPGQHVSTVGELVVPVNRPVRFVIRSQDVMHSFWVPAWGMKKAAMPGETRTMVMTPTKITDTSANPLERVQCAQICGAGHARMRAAVRVVSTGDFTAWIAREQQEGAKEGGMQMNGGTVGGSMGGMNMNGGNQNTMPMAPGNQNVPANKTNSAPTNGMQMNGTSMNKDSTMPVTPQTGTNGAGQTGN